MAVLCMFLPLEAGRQVIMCNFNGILCMLIITALRLGPLGQYKVQTMALVPSVCMVHYST